MGNYSVIHASFVFMTSLLTKVFHMLFSQLRLKKLDTWLGAELKVNRMYDDTVKSTAADSVKIHQVASALDYAHSNGFVHSNIKPESILISKVS